MKSPIQSKRLTYAPTRSRRLNEMLGLIVLVAACLLVLALMSYTPSDPSFNTVGGATGTHPAHNWTGIAGAYIADLLLQSFGVAVLFLPLTIGRIGVSWLRSRAVGSTAAKLIGLVLWLTFAPAAIALLPGDLLWRKAIPIAGVEGRILSEALVRIVNLPGTIMICGLMVALSLYLSTTFLLATARGWFTEHLSFIGATSARWQAWKHRKDAPVKDSDAFASKRQQAAAAALKNDLESDHKRRNSLLAGLFGWFGRRKAAAQDAAVHESHGILGLEDEPASVWQSRSQVSTLP
jgi:S-DNA-T family DNA segregation ATPase FtsK/SpoIIIE